MVFVLCVALSPLTSVCCLHGLVAAVVRVLSDLLSYCCVCWILPSILITSLVKREPEALFLVALKHV